MSRNSKRKNKKRKKRKINMSKIETKSTEMKKKRLILVLGSKGGIGKSVYCYNVGNIFQREGVKSYYFDMDNESKSSSDRQMRFVDMKQYNLINTHTKTIDRSMLGEFLDDMLENEKAETVLCDFGAASSEQFLVYLQSSNGRALFNDYKDEIQFEFHCVMVAGNSFPMTADYCEDLFAATKKLGKLFIAQNNHYPFTQVQKDEVKKIKREFKPQIVPYTIILDDAANAVEKVKQQMYNGAASYDISRRSTRLLYNLMLDEMNFPLK